MVGSLPSSAQITKTLPKHLRLEYRLARFFLEVQYTGFGLLYRLRRLVLLRQPNWLTQLMSGLVAPDVTRIQKHTLAWGLVTVAWVVGTLVWRLL